MKTRQGCEVSVERVGASVGVTIVQPTGKRDLFACGADEAAEVARLLAPAEPDLAALERAYLDALRAFNAGPMRTGEDGAVCAAFDALQAAWDALGPSDTKEKP